VVQWAKYEIFDPRQQIADNQSQKDSDPGYEAARPYRQRNDEQHDDERRPLIGRPVCFGDDRGKVEPDEHNDGAGHRRWQNFMDYPRSGDLDDDAANK
jgi:hypothetical protein